MNAHGNRNNQTASSYKMKKFSISALSLIICGCTATSALADTLSDQECVQLSRQYDDTIQMKQNWETMAGTCQIGYDSLCTRTDHIEMEQAQENLKREIVKLKDELTSYCPSYAEGL